jgi:acyl-CoA synthetase (AMP-forming)/AMP-acid ligase II/thioesterase domain-containing protein
MADVASVTNRIAGYSTAQIRELAKKLAKDRSASGDLKRQEEQRNTFPLSCAQEGFWFLEQLMPKNPSFSWVMAVRFRLGIDAGIWRRTLDELVRRHEILRTRYIIEDGVPVQFVEPFTNASLRIEDLRAIPYDLREAELTRRILEETRRGFDVEKETLCRFLVLQIAEEESVLCAAQHLSIIDAWCRKVFMNEMSAIVATLIASQPPPPALRVQYGDYALWERKTFQGHRLEVLLKYWKEQLGDMPDLDLPTDFRRPPIQRLHGETVSMLLPKRVTDCVKELAQREGATPFMAFLSVFQLLLMRYSGQKDIGVGVPVVNRSRVELELLLGRFVNTLVLRTNLDGNITFRELLARVRKVTVEGLAHQELPFELLVRELRIKRELDRNPLCRVMFQLEDIPGRDLSSYVADSSVVSPLDVKTGASVWDLNLHIFSDWDSALLERPEQLRAVLYYDAELFRGSTAARFLTHYKNVLERIIENPEESILGVPLSDEMNAALVPVQPQQVIQREIVGVRALFEKQVKTRADAVAIVAGDKEITYDELNRTANRLASYLLSVGVSPGKKIGVAVSGGYNLVIVLLAIVKSGACWVPLCREESAMRWKDISVATGLTYAITESRLAKKLDGINAITIELDEGTGWLESHSSEDCTHQGRETHDVCERYGSFGGRTITDESLFLRRIQWFQDTFQLKDGEGVLHLSSLSHIAADCEIFWPLLFGGRVVLASDSSKATFSELYRIVDQCSVSFFFTEASRLSRVANGYEGEMQIPLRAVFVSGEVPTASTLRGFFTNIHCQVWHLLSPEEIGAEIAATCFNEDEPDKWWCPISMPTGVVSVSVLDEAKRSVPAGALGELYAHSRVLLPDLGNEDGGPPEEDTTAQMRSTGDVVRLVDDGTFEIRSSTTDGAWIGATKVHFSMLKEALLRDPSVKDCAVCARKNIYDENELVTYIVSLGTWNVDKIRTHLLSFVAPSALPSVYVPVTTIPLTSGGEVDRRALEKVEVIDNSVVRAWERSLASLPDIREAAVVVNSCEHNSPNRIHLDKLLPVKSLSSGRIFGSQAKCSELESDAAETLSSANAHEMRLSISHGETLIIPPEMPAILADVLEYAARHYPNNGVLYIAADLAEARQSYLSVLEYARRIMTGLREAGLRPGDKVILQLTKNENCVEAFWGCVLGGFVPIPIGVPPSYGAVNPLTAKLTNAWKMFGHPMILSESGLRIPLQVLGEQLELVNFRVCVVEQLLEHAPAEGITRVRPDDVALILLTSGSTGLPKGVQLTHRNLISRAAAIVQQYGFSHADVSLNWMPLDHVGGIVMFHLQDVYNGCNQLHVETDVIMQAPLLWMDLIHKHRVTVTWAPNFAFAMVNNQASKFRQHHWDLSSLRFILNAGEAIVSRTARRFLQLLQPFGLPQTAMHPAWGMSETCSAVTFADQFTLQNTSDDSAFVELGFPIPGFSMRVVDGECRVVSEGEHGRLQVKGLSVTQGYYNRPHLDSDVFDDGWFETGDMAYIRNGQLTIVGRTKDVIIINGINYYSHEVEAVVEEIDAVEVSYTAACGVRRSQADTEQLAIFFSPRVNGEYDVYALIREIRALVFHKVGIAPDYIIPLNREQIPKTSIGKIQRSQLRQQLEAGEFDYLVKQLDLGLENAKTIPDWFHQRTWRVKKTGQLRDSLPAGNWLIFVDELGLGDSLIRELVRAKRSVVRIENGNSFAVVNSSSYQINAGDANDYRKLFAVLDQSGWRPDEIVHLWTYGPDSTDRSNTSSFDQALDEGAFSLLHLFHRLVERSARTTRLTVLSSHSQPAPDREIYCERAAVRGLLKGFAQENCWIRCYHIELPGQGTKSERRAIVNELRSSREDLEVLYTDRQRMVTKLQRVRFSPLKEPVAPFREDAFYLISGGLGGIGFNIARHLLTNWNAKLVLIGRSKLSSEIGEVGLSEWAWEMEEKRGRLQELKQLGEVMYEVANVEDLAAVSVAVERGKEKWDCELGGVLHLAGLSTERLIIEETTEGLKDVLAPKLQGARVLRSILGGDKQKLFISFSSALTLQGAMGMSAYSAANEVLECFAYAEQARGFSHYCLAWSLWESVGMSRRYSLKSAYGARGLTAISVPQGINALLLALYHDISHLIVGLNSASAAIRCQVVDQRCETQSLYGYFTSEERSSIVERIKAIKVSDRFGTRTTIMPNWLSEMPITESGAIDLAKLSARASAEGGRKREKAEPRTQKERDIVALWKEVLGIEDVGIHDDFFAIGGHSILAAQLMAAIRGRFRKDLPLKVLLEQPTVSHLAAVLGGDEAASSNSSLVAINASGNRAPLFLVHPAGGNVLCYYELAMELGPKQPVYGLEDASLRTNTPLPGSIEEMGRTYLREIRRVQAHGPYSIGGWSLGGVIAFEMARQLLEQGEETALLAIIDVDPPYYATDVCSSDAELPDAIDALINLGKMLEIYLGVDLWISKEDLAVLTVDERIDYVYRIVKESASLPLEVDLDYFRRYLRAYDENLRALYRYVPRSYAGPVVLFKSTEHLTGMPPAERNAKETAMGWQQYCSRPVAVHPLSGNHFTMMAGVSLRDLAKLLQSYLGRRVGTDN